MVFRFTEIFSVGDSAGATVGGGGLLGSGVGVGAGFGTGVASTFGRRRSGVAGIFDRGSGVGSMLGSEVGSRSGRVGASCAQTEIASEKPAKTKVHNLIFIRIL